jgi:hypothetical protein
MAIRRVHVMAIRRVHVMAIRRVHVMAIRRVHVMAIRRVHVMAIRRAPDMLRVHGRWKILNSGRGPTTILAPPKKISAVGIGKRTRF